MGGVLFVKVGVGGKSFYLSGGSVILKKYNELEVFAGFTLSERSSAIVAILYHRFSWVIFLVYRGGEGLTALGVGGGADFYGLFKQKK